MGGGVRVDDAEADDRFVVLPGHIKQSSQQVSSDAVTASIGPHHNAVHHQDIWRRLAVTQRRPGRPPNAVPQPELSDDVPAPERGERSAVQVEPRQADQLIALKGGHPPIGVKTVFDQPDAAISRPNRVLQLQTESVPVEVGGFFPEVHTKANPNSDLILCIGHGTGVRLPV